MSLNASRVKSTENMMRMGQTVRRSDIIKSRLRAARWHTIWVRIIRIIVPIGFISLLIYLFASFYEKDDKGPLLKETNAEELDQSEIVMDGPKINGVDDRGIPYSFVAKTAIQPDPAAEDIHLDQMVGIFNQGPGESRLLATEAIYARDAQILNILSSGRYATSDGKIATFPQAVIDVNKQHVSIGQGVQFTSPTTSLKAKTAELNDKDKIYDFSGRVEARLQKGARPVGDTQSDN